MTRAKQPEVAMETVVNLLKLRFSCKFFKNHTSDPFGTLSIKKDLFLQGHSELLEELFKVTKVLNKSFSKACLEAWDAANEYRFTKSVHSKTEQEKNNWLDLQAYGMKQLVMDVRVRAGRVSSDQSRQTPWMRSLISHYREPIGKPTMSACNVASPKRKLLVATVVQSSPDSPCSSWKGMSTPRAKKSPVVSSVESHVMKKMKVESSEKKRKRVDPSEKNGASKVESEKKRLKPAVKVEPYEKKNGASKVESEKKKKKATLEVESYEKEIGASKVESEKKRKASMEMEPYEKENGASKKRKKASMEMEPYEKENGASKVENEKKKRKKASMEVESYEKKKNGASKNEKKKKKNKASMEVESHEKKRKLASKSYEVESEKKKLQAKIDSKPVNEVMVGGKLIVAKKPSSSSSACMELGDKQKYALQMGSDVPC